MSTQRYLMCKLGTRVCVLAAVAALTLTVVSTTAHARTDPKQSALSPAAHALPNAKPSAAASPVPRPDLAGVRYRDHGGRVYVVDPDGYLRWIPDPATYDNLFYRSGVHDNDFIRDYIVEGPQLTSGAILVRSVNDGRVGLVSNGVVRHITDPATMGKYAFKWPTVLIPAIVYDTMSQGAEWH